MLIVFLIQLIECFKWFSGGRSMDCCLPGFIVR